MSRHALHMVKCSFDTSNGHSLSCYWEYGEISRFHIPILFSYHVKICRKPASSNPPGKLQADRIMAEIVTSINHVNYPHYSLGLKSPRPSISGTKLLVWMPTHAMLHICQDMRALNDAASFHAIFVVWYAFHVQCTGETLYVSDTLYGKTRQWWSPLRNKPKSL